MSASESSVVCKSTKGRYRIVACQDVQVLLVAVLNCTYKVPHGQRRFGISTAEWSARFHQIIFKFRYDVQFKRKVKSGKAFICEKHFLYDDMQRTSHKSWIKPGCLPSLNMPVKSISSKETTKRRKLIRYSACNTGASNISRDDDFCIDADNTHLPEINNLCLLDIIYLRVHGTASISILISENDNKLSFNVAKNGRFCQVMVDQISLENWNLEDILNKLTTFKCCAGYESVIKEEGWLHMPAKFCADYSPCNSCAVVIAHADMHVCYECEALQKLQMSQKNRHGRRIARLLHKPLSRCTAVTRANKLRLAASWKIQQKRLQEMEKEFYEKGVTVSDQCAEVLESVSHSQKDNQFLKEWWSVQKELQRSKIKYARRYSPSVIRFCLKLYAKSPSAYQLVRKVLILPDHRRLRSERNKSGFLQIGLQDDVLLRIKNSVTDSGDETINAMVVLAFDEMTIKEEIAYSSTTEEIIGYVDFGEETLTECSKSKEAVATHILAVFSRGIMNKELDGVVAYYPTKGITYQELFHVISDLLTKLPFRTSVIITGLVFDGLAANRTVMKLLASACDDDIPYRMRNPLEPSRYIYFIPDPPHLIKTCRNNLVNRNKNLWNNGSISVDPIKDLIREDLRRDELRLFHKLTESHVMPTSWEKMNVKLAAQLLSETVGIAMQERGFTSLAEFILNIDKWFDYMNAGFQNSNFKASRKPYSDDHDSRLAWLEYNFPNYLAQWRRNAEVRCAELRAGGTINPMLLSQSTEEGLLIASLSMSAVVKECLSSGASYVLARRINQDPIEAFFGYQRRRGGRGEAPTIRAFSSSARNFNVLRCSAVPGANVSEVV